jgi:hypothetical protein
MQLLISSLCAAFAGLTLPYPQHRFAAEFAIQWLFLLVEPSRLFLGERKGQRMGTQAHAQAARHHSRAAGAWLAVSSSAANTWPALFLPA